MMLAAPPSLMPADDSARLRLEADAESSVSSLSTTLSPASCLRLSPSPLLTTKNADERLMSVGVLSTSSSVSSLRRRVSPPPLDDLNTPATFTPSTYSCAHFVFDGVVGGDFALTTVDELPTSVDALDNGSVTAASSSSVEKDVVLVDNNNSNSDGQCTATVSDLPLSPTLTALPLLQPATTVSDVTAAQESRDQKPRDMTLSAVEPTAAADDEVPVAEEPPSLTLRTSGVEGSSTLTLLGELLPHQQQHEHSVPSGSLSVMSASHVAMDVDDRDRTDGIQSSVRPRYGVVVNSLPGPSARPRSRSPATCLVDDRRFFSPLIVHRAVACPYPIPFGVVGAHPAAGCFFEPQRCWWQPPPQATSSSTSLQTSLSELCSSDGTASAALQRLFCDVNAAQMTSSSADRKLEARTLPASAVTSTTASSRRSSRRDRVSPGPVTAKSFTCPAPDCGRSFSRSDELARHGRVHSGERPFSCTVCGRAFSRRDHLATHVRTHTGEKPYSCEVCARSFARSDERNRHRRVHGKASTAEPRNTAPPARHLEQTCTGL